MKPLITIFFITTHIYFIIFCLSSSLSKKMYWNREKPSPFECDFHPTLTARFPFSLRFFLIAMIFIIFDVEIALLLPLPLIQGAPNWKMMTITALLFLILLLIGLIFEWNHGMLQWAS